MQHVSRKYSDEIHQLHREIERHLREKMELAAMVAKERDRIERLLGLLQEAAPFIIDDDLFVRIAKALMDEDTKSNVR